MDECKYMDAYIKQLMSKLTKNCAISMRSSKLMSCLSLSTMCILILSSIVIITIISITPIIILGLGEIQSGQRDLILYPKNGYLNATQIQNISGHPLMPRFQTILSIDGFSSAKAVFMDFTKEKQQHLGTIGGNEPPNHNFVYLHSSFEIAENKTINLKLTNIQFLQNLSALLEHNIIKTPYSSEIQKQISLLEENQNNIGSDFLVKRIFETAEGKFAMNEASNLIFLDIQYALLQMVEASLNRRGITERQSYFVRFMKEGGWSLSQMSTEATINFENRIEVYSNPNYDETYSILNKFSKEIMDKIGLFAIESSMPIAQNLLVLNYFGMFMGILLKLIIVSLFILSVIMMNNMLMMSVERKNFDYALLKVMGANSWFIIANLLTSSMKYVLVANAIAYPFAYLALYNISGVFETYLGYRYNITPNLQAMIGGLTIGILVPLISAIFPITDILNNDLVQNLNPIRNKTQAIHTQIYVQGRQFPWGKLIFGLLATSYGLMIYFLLPRAMINLDLGLLLTVFFIILEGLLIGLILFSYSFQYILEKVIAYALFFWLNQVDFTLMLKNLSSHRFKNRKTSILYALSVSFIILVSVGLQIQTQTIYHEFLKRRGCYVQISSPVNYLNRSYYNEMLSGTDGIEDWAYRSQPLQQYMSKVGVEQIMVSDKAKLFFARNLIYAVSPNILNTLYFNEFSVYKSEVKEPYDPYSYLYSVEGADTCTLSRYVADRFNILEGDSNKQFYFNIYYRDKVQRYPIKYSTIFQTRNSLFYSSIVSRSELGISFDTFKKIANINDDQLPLQSLNIKISRPSEALLIANSLRKKISSQNISPFDKVWDYSQLSKTISDIQRLLNNVLNILLCIVLVISMFSLITTTYINIINQSKEIGILMICGYSKYRIVKIYILESFVLVLNSCLIGYLIGCFTAWMIALQRELFSDMPVKIEVQGVEIIMIFAVVSSVVCTIQPLREIFRHNINQIINYSQ